MTGKQGSSPESIVQTQEKFRFYFASEYLLLVARRPRPARNPENPGFWPIPQKTRHWEARRTLFSKRPSQSPFVFLSLTALTETML
jgi:hypothetical protein